MAEGDSAAFDGALMAAPESLIAAMKGKAPGTALQVSILRGGTTLPVSVLLGSQPQAWDEMKRIIARVEPDDALPAEIAALRSDLDTLQQHLDELEAELARQRGGR